MNEISYEYLKEKYGIDINADELRKKHVSNIKSENDVDKIIFRIVIKLLKEKRFNIINLYMEFIKNPNIVEFLNQNGTTIEECVEEGMSSYSYEIGYILGNYIKNRNDRNEILNMILNYKDNGFNAHFSIDDGLIQESFSMSKYTK